MNSVRRPWQGTVLAIVQIIRIAIGILGFLFIFLVGGAFFGGFSNPAMQNLQSTNPNFGLTFWWTIAIILLATLALYIFIIRGTFIGQKWAIIVALIFTIFTLLLGIPNIQRSLLTYALEAFALYLEIVCLQNPFYNKGKKAK